MYEVFRVVEDVECRRNLPPPSSLGSGALCFSEIFVPIYQTVCCHNPEDHNLNFHHHENLRSRVQDSLTMTLY